LAIAGTCTAAIGAAISTTCVNVASAAESHRLAERSAQTGAALVAESSPRIDSRWPFIDQSSRIAYPRHAGAPCHHSRAPALVHRKSNIQWRIAMRTILLATTVIAGLGLVGVSAASAAPIQGAAVIAAQQSKDVIRVANGCGIGWHWSWRWRRCVRN
jgi:hypothetical protein